MESMVVYSMNGSILSSPLFAGYEKISEQCPMTLSQLTTIDKLKVVIVFLLGMHERKKQNENKNIFALYFLRVSGAALCCFHYAHCLCRFNKSWK